MIELTETKTFNANEDWTVPVGLRLVFVEGCGGGGGGGAGLESSSKAGCGGGGGGAGVSYIRTFLLVTPGTNISVRIGDGGVPGIANQSGGRGGDSSFGIIRMTGGAGGGKGGPDLDNQAGGLGGAAEHKYGSLGTSGGVGGRGEAANGEGHPGEASSFALGGVSGKWEAYWGGAGGGGGAGIGVGGPGGTGGNQAREGVAAGPNTGAGGGGGGGGDSSAGGNGGSGGSGKVILSWYSDTQLVEEWIAKIKVPLGGLEKRLEQRTDDRLAGIKKELQDWLITQLPSGK